MLQKLRYSTPDYKFESYYKPPTVPYVSYINYDFSNDLPFLTTRHMERSSLKSSKELINGYKIHRKMIAQ